MCLSFAAKLNSPLLSSPILRVSYQLPQSQLVEADRYRDPLRLEGVLPTVQAAVQEEEEAVPHSLEDCLREECPS